MFCVRTKSHPFPLQYCCNIDVDVLKNTAIFDFVPCPDISEVLLKRFQNTKIFIVPHDLN